MRCFVEYIETHSTQVDDIVTLLHLALEEANRYVFYLAQQSEEYQGMGTTFVAVTICGSSLYCINVGDSRLYQMKPRRSEAHVYGTGNAGSFAG